MISLTDCLSIERLPMSPDLEHTRALQIWSMSTWDSSVHEAPRYQSNIRLSLLQRHTLITKGGLELTSPCPSPLVRKLAQTKASRRKTKRISKSTASHVRSPIMHFGSHPYSDCQRSEHMALIVAFPPPPLPRSLSCLSK